MTCLQVCRGTFQTEDGCVRAGGHKVQEQVPPVVCRGAAAALQRHAWSMRKLTESMSPSLGGEMNKL